MTRHRAPGERRPRTYPVLALAAVAALLTGLVAWFGLPRQYYIKPDVKVA